MVCENTVQSIFRLNFSSIWIVQKMMVLPETSCQSSLSAYFSSCTSLNCKSPEMLLHASVSIIWATTPSHKLMDLSENIEIAVTDLKDKSVAANMLYTDTSVFHSALLSRGCSSLFYNFCKCLDYFLIDFPDSGFVKLDHLAVVCEESVHLALYIGCLRVYSR